MVMGFARAQPILRLPCPADARQIQGNGVTFPEPPAPGNKLCRPRLRNLTNINALRHNRAAGDAAQCACAVSRGHRNSLLRASRASNTRVMAFP
jgi:hypothetical protein